MTEMGKLQKTIKGYADGITAISYGAHNGLVSGSTRGITRIWDIKTASEKHTFSGHISSINSICFNSTNGLILTASKDRYVNAYDHRSGRKPTLILPQHKDWVMRVEAPHMYPYIIRSADKCVNTWDLRKASVALCSIAAYNHRHRQLISGLKSDGLRLISSSLDGTVRISSVEDSSTDISVLRLNNDWIMSTDFLETQLVAGTVDGRLEIYDFIGK